MVSGRMRGFLCLLLLATGVGARDVPAGSSATHVGVGACSSSLCHGAVAPWKGSRVQQNEYRVWRDRDPHARAFDALRGDASRRITANLGWGPADADQRCLACHTDDVAAERRGKELRATDGVGCEACHGGASGWIESHSSPTASHQDDVDRGMYPTDDPQKRAELCLSCHFGTSRQRVTHGLLAAGHPRLAFELDTFTQNQPAHYLVDDDYRARKASPTSAQVWAVGQGVALREYLAALAERGAHDHGWMDYALLDCTACHHAVGAQPVTVIAPNARVGLPRLSGANFLMFRRVLGVLDAAAAERVDHDLRELGQAMRTRGLRPPPTVGAMRDRAAGGVERVGAWTVEPKTLRMLLTTLLAAEPDATYLVAEQQAMAIQSTVATMKERGLLAADCSTRMERALDRLFATTHPEGFRPAAFRDGLQDVARARCD
jgi:hypothetical protein